MADRPGLPSRRARVLGLLRAALIGAPLTVLPWPGPAQTPPVSLVADDVAYDAPTERLTAEGNVEVFYEGRVLRASRIDYDAATDEILATGPLTLTDPDGVVFLADAAQLTPDLRAGLVQGARLMIAGQLQLAASELRRSGDRYNTLYNSVASSCVVCAENPTPTWAVRAARITQDEVTQRIYFENATVEFFGVPVAYAPRLSFPDPRVKRASGFLLPELLQSDIYGFGFRLPYYRVLGPHADATVTPFVTTLGGVLLEGEYRQRFALGGFDVAGVVAATDALGENAGRASFSGVGDYLLPRDFRAEFDFSYASDETFLQQYDISDTDLLTSVARIQRTRADEYFDLGTIAFQSLRENEDTSTVPFILPNFTYLRTFTPDDRLGRFGMNLDALGVTRQEGRDVFRAGGGGDWRQDWTTPQGLLVAAEARANFDVYQISNDPVRPDSSRGRIVPTASVELSWPFLRSRGRAEHVIEPTAQLVYAEIVGNSDVPNEDSLLPEFDETNLFSLNRFPGRDRYETGFFANLGISYTRYDPSGWSLGLTLGRVLHSEPLDDFGVGTGLDGHASDYVGALSFDFDWGLTVVNRVLFDDDLDFRRNEVAFGYDGEFGSVAAAYVYLAADASNPVLGDQPETNEFSIEASYRVRPNWEISGLWRYDVATNSNLRAGAGVTYGNECAEFDLSVSRRYTSSANLPPSTSISFGLRLAGIGEGETRDWPARVCMTRGA